MRPHNPLISIVVSLYNEQENINELYKQLTIALGTCDNINFEIIFVNDGSTDDSFPLLQQIIEKDAKVKIVNLVRNFGHEIAMSAGLDFANGDCILFMDADLQHPPELAPIMINEWKKGKDIVLTNRKNTLSEKWIDKLISKLFYKILNSLSDVHIASQYPDFRLVDRKYGDIVKRMKENNRMFRGLISWLGVKNQSVIDFVAPTRFAGKSKYNTKKLISLAMDSIISFSIKPLRMATYMGIITAIVSILLGVFFVIGFVTSDTYQFTGYGTTILMVIFIGSIQLIVLGIFGEYLGRIHLEIKNRPLYIAELYTSDSVK